MLKFFDYLFGYFLYLVKGKDCGLVVLRFYYLICRRIEFMSYNIYGFLGNLIFSFKLFLWIILNKVLNWSDIKNMCLSLLI